MNILMVSQNDIQKGAQMDICMASQMDIWTFQDPLYTYHGMVILSAKHIFVSLIFFSLVPLRSLILFIYREGEKDIKKMQHNMTKLDDQNDYISLQ